MPIQESAFTSGYVVGVLIRSLADSTDVGDSPDVLPATVKPTFTRVTGQYRLPFAATDTAGAHGALVQHDKVEAAVIQTGEYVGHITDDIDPVTKLAAEGAVPGVRLVIGTYKVSFGGHFPDLPSAEVTAEHTQEAPLDLADLVGYTPLPGVTVTTVALPTGGATGQALVLSGSELVWADLPAGADGKSAYEVAVANGFIGTESEWLTSLAGADGAPGAQGDTGPAPSLAIGTVTKLAAGATPTATFTGTNPYTLNLGLVDGAAGAGGIPTGTGMPNGVRTGSPGDEYIDTAGTNGARHWIKTSGTATNTGWEVLYGDTGWRSLTVSAGWTAVCSSAVVAVKRRGSLVEAYFRLTTTTTSVPAWPNAMVSIPTGFRLYTATGGNTQPVHNIEIGSFDKRDGLLTYIGWNHDIAKPTQPASWTFTGNYSGYTSWATSDAWPTTLPGTAA